MAQSRVEQEVQLLKLGRFARSLYQERRVRDAFLGPDLFGEASWDLLLDLFASELEGRPVRVSSACIAASVPATTALRYIKELERRGIVVRAPAPGDGRAQHLRLSEAAKADLTQLLRRLEADRPGSARG